MDELGSARSVAMPQATSRIISESPKVSFTNLNGNFLAEGEPGLNIHKPISTYLYAAGIDNARTQEIYHFVSGTELFAYKATTC